MTANTERDIFVHAHQLDSDAERETYLNEACAGRPELLDRVKKLFEANAIEDEFLATPAAADDRSLAAPCRWTFSAYQLSFVSPAGV